MDLHEISKKYNTDKSNHLYKGISYLHVYEPYLKNKQEKNINILEIGVLRGGSLKMWKEYFPNASIIGLDINPGCSQYTEERIEIFIGSQDDVSIKNEIKNKYKMLDLIVDDGSHVNELTFQTFSLYWPLLNDNGIYIIEDTHCCYADLTKVSRGWPGISHNRSDIEYNNLKNNSFDKFCLTLIRMICRGPGIDTSDLICDNIFNLSFFPNTLVITKK